MGRMGVFTPSVAGMVAAAMLSVPRPVPAQQQGIKVHGHWVVEVRDANGTIRSRHEFENELATTTGSETLAKVLSGTVTMGKWEVFVIGTNGPCRDRQSLPAPCATVDPTLGFTDPFYFLTLARIVRQNTSTTNWELVLQGSVVAAVDGDISTVQSTVVGTGVFTQRSLPAAIPVGASQTVAVTVTLSFS